jgi:U3 small nucleolar RNA-associated protein 11
MTKKVFHSREHRERAQPANRVRLGLLEKKKDYVLRARDFQSKKKRLHAMKVKAAYKNPDEFYFGMIKSRVDKATGKVRQEAEHEKLSGEVVKLMKSQDLKHIQEMIRTNEAKLENFKAEHAIVIGKRFNSQKSKGNHVKFIQDDEELADLILNFESGVGGGSANGEGDSQITADIDSEAVTPASSEDQIVLEYQARADRIKILKIAEKKLLQEKMAAAKGRKRKIGEDQNGIPIYKFDQERKK